MDKIPESSEQQTPRSADRRAGTSFEILLNEQRAPSPEIRTSGQGPERHLRYFDVTLVRTPIVNLGNGRTYEITIVVRGLIPRRHAPPTRTEEENGGIAQENGGDSSIVSVL